jgi:predicted SprT family Zn-dependent metalloprotease
MVSADNAGSTTMPECKHCGAHVSDRFARVFADERGRVYACPSCSANAGIAEVARQRAREA